MRELGKSKDWVIRKEKREFANWFGLDLLWTDGFSLYCFFVFVFFHLRDKPCQFHKGSFITNEYGIKKHAQRTRNTQNKCNWQQLSITKQRVIFAIICNITLV